MQDGCKSLYKMGVYKMFNKIQSDFERVKSNLSLVFIWKDDIIFISFYSFLILFLCMGLSNSCHHFQGPNWVRYFLVPQGDTDSLSLEIVTIHAISIYKGL